MTDAPEWHDVGSAEELQQRELQEVTLGRTKIAISFREGRFSAVSGVCNHVGGPLGQGRLDGEYVVCPWHAWKFHHRSGQGEPGFEDDQLPVHEVKVEAGRVLVAARPSVPRHRRPHPPHPLEQVRSRGEEGGAALDAPWRVLGVSTTSMNLAQPRFSGSEHLLELALGHAAAAGAETRLIRLRELSFRACEGYYSKSARACTWPCSITQMDPGDELDRLYEAFVQWCDVVLVATSIRWGNASSLYYKMAERMNCIQNQLTIADRVLLKNKVVSFIIIGGQDNIQAVAGQLMNFFGELGCHFPQFPYIAHSRGWSAEDMERNVEFVEHSRDLRRGAEELVERCLTKVQALIGQPEGKRLERGGRKAHQLDVKAQQ